MLVSVNDPPGPSDEEELKALVDAFVDTLEPGETIRLDWLAEHLKVEMERLPPILQTNPQIDQRAPIWGKRLNPA